MRLGPLQVHLITVFTASIGSVSCFDFTNLPTSTAQSGSFLSNTTSHQSIDKQSPPDSVLYNVSSLGLPDPFSHYSTHLTYDSKVEIGDPHNNQKGSILTLLNGTVYPLGSIGAINAIGWEGDSNDTDINLEETTRTKAGQVKRNSNGGLSGIWLAFTSQDALTGGYTLNNETLTTSNNLVYQNLTFLSNFTMHHDGSYTFKFSFATVPEQDKQKTAQLEAPQCIEKKDDQQFSMTCTGKRKNN